MSGSISARATCTAAKPGLELSSLYCRKHPSRFTFSTRSPGTSGGLEETVYSIASGMAKRGETCLESGKISARRLHDHGGWRINSFNRNLCAVMLSNPRLAQTKSAVGSQSGIFQVRLNPGRAVPAIYNSSNPHSVFRNAVVNSNREFVGQSTVKTTASLPVDSR